MTPNEFVKAYFGFAKKSQQRTRVPAVFTLAQAALESGWGASVKGNNFFGIKDTDGVNGNEQLLVTTEYHTTPNVKYPKILAITKLLPKRFRYKVMDYFRKYDSPEGSFVDHGNFLVRNGRYAKAFNYINDAEAFGREVARAGYATSPDYESTIVKMIAMIRREVKALGLSEGDVISPLK
jgi:flagellum-specific peptidoglycan hydrolase FlgJ